MIQQNSNSKDSDVCPLCHGQEFVLTLDEEGRSIAATCSCREKQIMKRKLQFADIPLAFKGHTLKNFKQDVYHAPESASAISLACGIIKEYLDNYGALSEQGMGLYIFSEAKGSGKTRMAASIANELITGQQVKFAVSTTIIQEIKKTWGKEVNYSESALLDALSTAQVLVIDDFGTEKIADWIDDKFYHIINERYINKKVTIITSNYSLSNLPYNDRIKSRIMERSYQIRFPEESVRATIAEEREMDLMKKLFESGGK